MSVQNSIFVGEEFQINFFLVSQKVIVIQQAVSCVGISSPYSCVESDVNKKDFEVIL